MHSYIFTADENAKQIALNEIKKLDPSSALERWLNTECGLMSSELDYKELSIIFIKTPPVFIRHICPVSVIAQYDTGLEVYDEALKTLAGKDKEKTFSVQTRIFTKDSVSKADINERLSNILISEGYCLDTANPQQVISVNCADKIYMGVSDANDNLSNWAGGMRRFMRNDGLISRAEFKLLEAIDVFKLKFKDNLRVLDLGAAPGGWTNVMLSYGASVYAVDPANLHNSLVNKVEHRRQTAQSFFLENKNVFDVILNDMKLDVKESTSIIVDAKPFLVKDGIAVITLKLPHKEWQRIAYQAIKYLSGHYKILGARQLFHNRSEVTVVLQTID